MMTGDARTQATYNAVLADFANRRQASITANQAEPTKPVIPDMTDADRASLQAGIRVMLAADLTYILGAAQVVPAGITVNAGQSVSAPPPSGLGNTTSPGSLSGTGTLQ